MPKRLFVRFCDALPNEGFLALAQRRLDDMPESWRHEAECSVVVLRRNQPDGERAIHHVRVDLDRGPARSSVSARSSDVSPCTALNRAFDRAFDSLEEAAE